MGTPLNSSMVFINSSSGTYPLTFEKIKQTDKFANFATDPTVEELREMGYFLVYPTSKPKGDVVTERDPVLDANNNYHQSWSVREFTNDELAEQLQIKKNVLLATISALKVKTLEVGAPIDFGAGYGLQHIQMRDGDRANILGLKVKAEAIIASGVDSTMGIRTYENVLVPLNAQEMLDLSWKILSSYEEVMNTAWHYEDLVKASENEKELPVLPELFLPVVKKTLTVIAVEEAAAKKVVEEAPTE